MSHNHASYQGRSHGAWSVVSDEATDVYDPVMYRLITFPLITIAAINGHGELCSLAKTRNSRLVC